MAITAEEIMSALDSHREELVVYMVEQTKSEISKKITWALQDEINKLVRAYIQEEIAPEIKSILVEDKPAILRAVITMTEELTKDLATAMLASARENLMQSYTRNEIVKKIFD